jgi:hypothetical protein
LGDGPAALAGSGAGTILFPYLADTEDPMPVLIALMFIQVPTPALENEYVRAWKDAAPCASAQAAGCSERVIVALGDLQIRAGGSTRSLHRGEIAAFKAGESYSPPTGGPYYEVAFKANHPPVQTTSEQILPEKNQIIYDSPNFFVFEEHLEVGDTRVRHTHSQRVVIQLNRTRLQQWPEGQPEVLRDIEPDGVAFNPPVIHTVKNLGPLPLRGIVLELKPSRGSARISAVPAGSRAAAFPPLSQTAPAARTSVLRDFGGGAGKASPEGPARDTTRLGRGENEQGVEGAAGARGRVVARGL